MAKSFTAKAAKGTMELTPLIPYNVRPEVTIQPRAVPFVTDAFGQVQDNCDREDVVLARQCHEGFARFGLDVRGIDHGQLPAGEPPGSDEVQRRERVVRCRLLVLIVRHEGSEAVRRQYFSRLELTASKRRLATAGGPDQDYQRQLRNRKGHARVNTAI